MTNLQGDILSVMDRNEKLTAEEIDRRIPDKSYGTRSIINSLCYLRGEGYVTDGRGATGYDNGIEVWKTPSEFDYHTEGEQIRWMKLPRRFAASPPEIQEQYGNEVIV